MYCWGEARSYGPAQVGLARDYVFIDDTVLGLTEDVTGEWLANLMVDYAEHGRYWRDQIVQSPDDMFEGIGNGDYTWLRA